MSDMDPLYDASGPSVSEKLERFAARLAREAFTVECPMERAMKGLACAVEELDGALLLARAPEAHAEIRQCAEDAINRLLKIQAVSFTLEQLERHLE